MGGKRDRVAAVVARYRCPVALQAVVSFFRPGSNFPGRTVATGCLILPSKRVTDDYNATRCWGVWFRWYGCLAGPLRRFLP